MPGKTLEKGQYLFRENDASDCMFVIKTGRLAIVKTKGSSEITLAELGPGQMLGEMAFFDNKPRSAGARALANTEVIVLPFKSLYTQFKSFPEWLKAMVRTVNSHLREANQRIKNLERASAEDSEFFSPHRMTKLMSILGFVAHRFGEQDKSGGISISYDLIRKYTIQVFQEPTNKMQKLIEVLEKMEHVTTQDLGEGRKQVTVKDVALVLNFVTFYNDYLFEEEDKRITVDEKEMKILSALLFYGRKANKGDTGEVSISLTNILNDSMRDLGYVVKPEETLSLVEKKLIGEHMSADGGQITASFNLPDLEKIYPLWDIVYTLKKVRA